MAEQGLTRRGVLVGTTGAAVAAATGAVAQDDEDDGTNGDEENGEDDDTENGANEEEGEDEDDEGEENGEDDDAENGEAAEPDDVTVDLVDYAYEPGTDQPLEIPPGTTVLFVWQTDTHNIAIDEQPDDSDWEGVEQIEDTGFEHEHTFEAEGTYEFHCTPHLELGMVGEIVVDPDAGLDEEEDTAPAAPTVPDEALSLFVGISLALLVTMSLAYFFMKYGGDSPTN